MNLQEILKNHLEYISTGDLNKRANLSEADLSGADLSGANLYGANLSEADLSGANLYGANLYGANLYGANLSEADLSEANLSEADLSEADLSEANLSEANLYGANLYGAKGIFTFNKLNGRICYAVIHKTGLMIKAGCFWGTLEQFEQACKQTYPNNKQEAYEAQIKYLKSI